MWNVSTFTDGLTSVCVCRMVVGPSSAAVLWENSERFYVAAVRCWWRNCRAMDHLNLAVPTWRELLLWITWTKPAMTPSRPEEAVISGRAGAWAPALWISTLETEVQISSLNHREPATLQDDIVSCTDSSSKLSASDPKIHFLPESQTLAVFKRNLCTSSVLLLQSVFRSSSAEWPLCFLRHLPDFNVASVPPECGLKHVPHLCPLIQNYHDSALWVHLLP